MGSIAVDFQVGGVKRVLEAFESVTKAQLKMERSVIRSVANDTKTREKGARSAEAIQEKRYRELQKSLSKEEKESDRVERSKLAAVQNAAKARDAIRMRSAEMAGRLAVQQANQEIRTLERAAKERNRIIAKEVSDEAAMRRRFTGNVAGQVMGSARGALGGIAKIGGGILALGGGFSVADGVQASVRNSGKAADLANQSGGKVSKQAILAKSAEVGSAMGTSTESVIEGLDAFVAKSGDVKAGFAGIQRLVEMAAATGADLGELSRTAGIIQMGTGDIDKTMDQMRVLAGGGRAGSVDMRELSQYAGRISAGANQFGDKGEAFNQLSTIVQQAAATGGATAAPEATEAVSRLSSDIFEHEEVFKDAKVKTRDSSGKFLRNPMDVIKDSISAKKGDTGELLAMYGKMSYRAVAGYQDVYNRKALEVTKGGGSAQAADLAGLAAIDEAFKAIADQALTDATVKADAARRLQESDRQLEMVLNQLREAVGRELVPELIKLIPQIRALIPAFTDALKGAVSLAEWFAKNPFAGIGLVVLGAVTKDLAAAGIGAAVKAALLALMSGQAVVTTGGAGAAAAGAGVTGAGAAATVGGAGLAAVAGTVIVGAGVGAGTGLVVSDTIANDVRGSSQQAVTNDLRNDAALSSISGGITDPKQLKRARALQAQITEEISSLQGSKGSVEDAGDWLKPIGAIGKLTGLGGDVGEAQAHAMAVYDKQIAAATESLKRLDEAIKKSEGALKGHAEVATKVPSPTGNPARTVSGAHPVRANR